MMRDELQPVILAIGECVKDLEFFSRFEAMMLAMIVEAIKGGSDSVDNLEKMADVFAHRMKLSAPIMLAGKYIIDAASQTRQ